MGDSPHAVNKRVTQIPQQSPQAGLGDKGNRHTTIVGPSSPVLKMIPNGNPADSPPALPGRERKNKNVSFHVSFTTHFELLL